MATAAHADAAASSSFTIRCIFVFLTVNLLALLLKQVKDRWTLDAEHLLGRYVHYFFM